MTTESAGSKRPPWEIETWCVHHGQGNERKTEWFLVTKRGDSWQATQPQGPAGFYWGNSPREAVESWAKLAAWVAPVAEKVEGDCLLPSDRSLLRDAWVDSMRRQQASLEAQGRVGKLTVLGGPLPRSYTFGEMAALIEARSGVGEDYLRETLSAMLSGRFLFDAALAEILEARPGESLRTAAHRVVLERFERNMRVVALEATVSRLDEAASMACQSPAKNCDCAGCLYAREMGGDRG